MENPQVWLLRKLKFLIPMVGRSQWPRGLRPLACWDRGFESHRGHGCLSVVSVVCCQLRRADHSSRGVLPTVVCRVWSRNHKNPREWGRQGPLGDYRAKREKKYLWSTIHPPPPNVISQFTPLTQTVTFCCFHINLFLMVRAHST